MITKNNSQKVRHIALLRYSQKKIGSRDILGSSKSSLFEDARQKACIFSTTSKPIRPLLEIRFKKSIFKFLDTSRKILKT